MQGEDASVSRFLGYFFGFAVGIPVVFGLAIALVYEVSAVRVPREVRHLWWWVSEALIIAIVFGAALVFRTTLLHAINVSRAARRGAQFGCASGVLLGACAGYVLLG